MVVYYSKIDEFSSLESASGLSISRQKKISCFRNIEDKKRCLVAGLLLKKVLKDDYYKIIVNENNKPYIPSSLKHFNLSHSGDIVVLSVFDHEVGVDIEKIEGFHHEITERFFSKDEKDYIYNSNDQIKSFYEIWTKKESFSKCIGEGLKIDFPSFSTILNNGAFSFKDSTYYIKQGVIDNYVYSVCSNTSFDIKLVRLSKEELLSLK